VSPVKYEMGFYIAEDDILHSHSRENLKSYIALTGWASSYTQGNTNIITPREGLSDRLHTLDRETTVIGERANIQTRYAQAPLTLHSFALCFRYQTIHDISHTTMFHCLNNAYTNSSLRRTKPCLSVKPISVCLL
jgi:hypothetical protein